MKVIKSNLRKQYEELHSLFRILRGTEYKINEKYYTHSNFVVFALMIAVLILLPIFQHELVWNSEYTYIPLILINTVFACVYYILCIDIYLKLKSIQDKAISGTLAAMPVSFKNKSYIRFIVIKNKIDVENIIMENLGCDVNNMNVKIHEESLKFIDSLSEEEKETAFVEYLEKSINKVTRSVNITNKTVLIYIFISTIIRIA